LTIRRSPGWTPVPHDVLEELARAPLPRVHHAVVVAIVRQTLGWHRPEVTIKVGDLARDCELHPRSVRRAIVDLEHWRVIIRRGAGQGRAARFRLQPPSAWRIGATVDALARRAVRLRAGLACQLELRLEGVGDLSVLPVFHTHPSVTSRDTPRATAREVETGSHTFRKKESVRVRTPAKVPAQHSDPAAWSDVKHTHQALSRRLEELGFRPPDDLFLRVGKALAHGRARGRIHDDPLAYAEFWVLEDLRKLGRQPIRRRGDEPVAFRTTDDDQIDFVKAEQTVVERREAAARMRLRWRSGTGPRQRIGFDDEEIAAEAATLSDQDVEDTFAELARRRAHANQRDTERRATEAGQHEFKAGERRRR
jgi:phage replication O-like protein O